MLTEKVFKVIKQMIVWKKRTQGHIELITYHTGYFGF